MITRATPILGNLHVDMTNKMQLMATNGNSLLNITEHSIQPIIIYLLQDDTGEMGGRVDGFLPNICPTSHGSIMSYQPWTSPCCQDDEQPVRRRIAGFRLGFEKIFKTTHRRPQARAMRVWI